MSAVKFTMFFSWKEKWACPPGTENDGIASKRIPAPPSFFRLFDSTNNRLPTQKEWTIFYVQKKRYIGNNKANTHFFI